LIIAAWILGGCPSAGRVECAQNIARYAPVRTIIPYCCGDEWKKFPRKLVKAQFYPGAVMFDQIDRKIIEILQQNAEKSVVEIAEEVGLSHTPCWRRIKRMEDIGLIRSKVALIDRRMANVPMTIFISVKVPRHTTTWLDDFRKEIKEIPEILEAYRLTGDADYLLRVVVPDIDVYDQVYKNLISRLEFSDLSSSIAMEEMKFTTALPTKYM
jgi:Lrp/AsnC family transcriptional regulator